jgi:GMP synthase-like glutamine amidotransferase/DNA-binding NarL/FixJ family response regulator
MRALALEHLRPNTLGVYGDVLEERGIGFDRIMLDEGEQIPDWRSYDFLVVMGAAVDVWDRETAPWIDAEERVVHDAVLAGVPYFGVCFGAQLLASAFGAHSYRGVEPELGINQVFLTAGARRDAVFRGFPPDVDVCEWHSNHFTLPAGAVRLARSPRYENQAIRLGRVAYGIQCHLETSREDLESWLELFPQTVGQFEARHGAGSLPPFLDDYGAFVPRLRETARQLFGRWLEHGLVLGNLAGTARALAGIRPRAAGPERGLLGREAEQARIERALAAAREGGSAVVVIRGEAGAGKSALLDDAVARARDLTIVRARGVDDSGEQQPFAGLADLSAPLIDRRDRIPADRAAALGSALGLEPPLATLDRYTVYAALLDLLTAVAEESPILAVVDDAHVLDEASVAGISFLAARLRFDGIALVIATESDDGFADGEEVRLRGLAPAYARALLAGRFGSALAAPVIERLVETAQGNPLALLEIPHDLTPDQRTGAAPLDGALPPSAEWAYLRRIESLPGATRMALLVAALCRDGAREAVVRAYGALDLDLSALAPAERAGLVAQDAGRIAFRHELARVAVSYSALTADRRRAHAALAGAVTGERRLWHRAHAATGPDEAIAEGLAAVAGRAERKGAYAAAAHAWEQAARLSPDPERRAKRLLDAARCSHLAGHVHAALDQLRVGLDCATTAALRTALEHARGRVAARSGSAERARDWLTSAATHPERDDPAKAAEILADAVLPALRAGSPADALRIARRAARLAGDHAASSSTLMLGTALVFAGEYEEGLALIERADAAGEPHPFLGAALALAGRHARARGVLEVVVADARSSGAVAALPYALVRLAGVELDTGNWHVAAAALEQAVELARETGDGADQGLALGARAWLEAARGQADACRADVDEALELAVRLGAGSRLDRAGSALGVLELGCGRPEHAIAPLAEVRRLQEADGWSDAAVTPHRLPNLIEAYALAGRRDEARLAFDAFRADAERTRRPSALAAAASCRALLASDAEFDERFTAALAIGAEVTGPFLRARVELLYGTRLAQAGRSGEAVGQLSAALDAFEQLGAEPWAGRARAGIRRAGGTPPAPRVDRLARLSPLELDVVLAAGDGASLDDVAHRLFLGCRTTRVLHASAMAKLGVDSAHDLPAQLQVDSAEE